MPKKPRRFISASVGGKRKVVIVQETESPDAPTSVPIVCPEEHYGMGHAADVEPPIVPDPIHNRGKDSSSNSYSCKTETQTNNSWDAKDKSGDDWNGAPSMAPTRVKCEAPFTCFSCGRLYKFRSRYDKHRKGCDVVGGVLSSSPVPTSFRLRKEIKIEARELPLDEGHNDYRGHLPPSLVCHLDKRPEPGVGGTASEDEHRKACGDVVDGVSRSSPLRTSSPLSKEIKIEARELPLDCGHHRTIVGLDDGGDVKRMKVESVLGDQAVCGTLGSCTSAKTLEPLTDSLSTIKISNVMSLDMSEDECLPMAGKTADKLSRRTLVHRCLRKHTRVRQKWLNPGGRHARCLLCGMQFSRYTALDQHMASAHYESFQYRCCSCNMSFKAWTHLCRHVLQAHRVKIQRSSRTSQVTKAKKCILKAKDKDNAEAKFIHNVKDASIDDRSPGRLNNDESRLNSEWKENRNDGLPHLCLFAMKNIQKGEQIVFNHGGVDLPWRPTTQSKKTQTLRTYSKNETTILQKVSEEARLSRLLTQRTEELAAERRETAARFSAMEALHKAEITSLRAGMKEQLDGLIAANKKLTEELAASRIAPPPATPQQQDTSPATTTPATPPTNSLFSRLKRQHPQIVIPELTPERERKISQLSGGRACRYGCYLFQAVVGTDLYHTWCCNTNWSGTGGKWELPRNLQEYLLYTLAEKFPGFGERETKMLIERINELLRKRRLFFYI